MVVLVLGESVSTAKPSIAPGSSTRVNLHKLTTSGRRLYRYTVGRTKGLVVHTPPLVKH
ncbi:MAG: hypothetical protein WAW62_00980 [Candidatus Saccharimonas aalborgensis]